MRVGGDRKYVAAMWGAGVESCKLGLSLLVSYSRTLGAIDRTMDTTKVIIENWPNDPWIMDWIPIIIAVIALIASIISLYWTRIEYVKSSRPYVWASNYGVI